MSTLIHTLMLVIILAAILPYPDPPPGQEGILVNLGLPDVGQGDDQAAPAETGEPEEIAEIPETEESVTEDYRPEEVTKPVEPEPVEQKEIIKTEDPEAIALKKEKERKKKLEEERIQKERDEAIRKQKEEEAKQKAAEEARKKKAAEEARQKAEADKLKNQIGGLFEEGEGRGNTGKPGDQGDVGGDPNSDILSGVSTGSGVVGGGLGSRGVRVKPKISDRTQKSGKVVIYVCVDVNGNVISADFTQKGSTTSDSELVSIAKRNANNWKFQKGEVDKQCGTITYEFKLK